LLFSVEGHGKLRHAFDDATPFCGARDEMIAVEFETAPCARA
jgi:hypothetical protein